MWEQGKTNVFLALKNHQNVHKLLFLLQILDNCWGDAVHAKPLLQSVLPESMWETSVKYKQVLEWGPHCCQECKEATWRNQNFALGIQKNILALTCTWAQTAFKEDFYFGGSYTWTRLWTDIVLLFSSYCTKSLIKKVFLFLCIAALWSSSYLHSDTKATNNN